MYTRNEDLLKELGQIIRKKRMLYGLTQVKLAQKCQMDRNYIGMLERGVRNPSYLSLLKIAEGLDMTVYQLIKP
jgi:transcriptional regulator with XRE-family HTH domain